MSTIFQQSINSPLLIIAVRRRNSHVVDCSKQYFYLVVFSFGLGEIVSKRQYDLTAMSANLNEMDYSRWETVLERSRFLT